MVAVRRRRHGVRGEALTWLVPGAAGMKETKGKRDEE